MRALKHPSLFLRIQTVAIESMVLRITFVETAIERDQKDGQTEGILKKGENPKALPRLPKNNKRILFIGNCSSHNLNVELDEALNKINTEARYFPANATDLLQPTDSFIIRKINAAWKRRQNRYKSDSSTNNWGGRILRINFRLHSKLWKAFLS